MTTRLDELYHKFYTPLELSELKSSIDENHKVLINNLSKKDRKCVLRIIDALNMICNYESKNSFLQGFELGLKLLIELQNYNPKNCENEMYSFGDFFTPNVQASE